MEIFDIVDEQGNPTGETVSRQEAHEKGIRHRTAHVWITRGEGSKTEILLQKRAACKDSFPGRFDTSSAGHIHAGDDVITSALRELEEELGLKADKSQLVYIDCFRINYQKEFHGKMFADNEIAFAFNYTGSVNEKELVLQEEEIEKVEWFNLEETYNQCLLHNQKFCVPIDGLKIIREYVKKQMK